MTRGAKPLAASVPPPVNAGTSDWAEQWRQMQGGANPPASPSSQAAPSSDAQPAWVTTWNAISNPRSVSRAQIAALPPEYRALLSSAPSASSWTPAQGAAAAWANTTAWQKPLVFAGRGITDVATGLGNTAKGLWHVASGQAFMPTQLPSNASPRRRQAFAQLQEYFNPKPQLTLSDLIAPSAPQPTQAQTTDQIMDAAEEQHPAYNYGVKWPTEVLASLPLGEGAGALAGKALPELPAAANLLTRVLSRVPAAAARGAAYGVQQPGGTPGTNAAVGAVAGPLFEGGAALGGKALGLTAEGAQGLYRKFFPRALTQPELDSVLSRRFAQQGLPSSVTPRQTAPGVELTTAVHSGNPKLMALQAAERIGGTGTPFYEQAGANNAAIVNGLQQRFAPQADNGAISSAAHDLLQSAQERGRAAVRAAYQPFDAMKGGVYLERGPVQNALREAYNGLLPAHREILPAKVQEVINGQGPLHLTNDVEDLSARLGDAIADAKPHSPASRALMVVRDALNKGVEEAPVAERPALSYDPTRAPLPASNTAASDASQHSILQWLALHPRGIDSGEAVAQGLDPADMRSAAARVGIKRAFRNGGMPFDQAAEALHQAGYPVADERGNYSPNVLLDQIDTELRGQPVYSNANTRNVAALEHEMATRPGAPPDLSALTARAMEASPERAQAILGSWNDDSSETIARVQQQLRALVPKPPNDAEVAWKAAKAANTAFRQRFPQGTARDTEARQWLSRWLSGHRDPTKFLTEAMVSPARAQTALDALKDSPGEREQMRGLLRNGYVNRLLSATREGIPGTRTLNADALTRARANNSALERVLLNPQERGSLDKYVQAAHDNQKILQRMHTGSSETAALRNYGKENETSLTEELLKHGASHLHPVAGLLAHLLPALAKSPDNQAALQRTLTSALLNHDVYNRVAAAPQQIQTPIARLLSGLSAPTRMALTRPAVVGTSRVLGPALSPAPRVVLARRSRPPTMAPRFVANRSPTEQLVRNLARTPAIHGGSPDLAGSQ